ncbi:MAG: hypothetical protein ACERKV_00710 [Clostridiaceae bacterium]
MKRDSKKINKDGFGYTNLTKSLQIDWVSEPHFYKSGNIIVQYIGTNEEIISLLEDILGEQFAGIA